MIILGLDLATQSGFCFGRPDSTPTAGTVRAPVTGKDLGAFGAFYLGFFNRTLDQLAARLAEGEHILVNYEAPVLPQQTTIETTRKLQGLGMLLETAPTDKTVPSLVEAKERLERLLKGKSLEDVRVLLAELLALQQRNAELETVLKRNRAALDLIDPMRPLQYATTMDLMRKDMDAALLKSAPQAGGVTVEVPSDHAVDVHHEHSRAEVRDSETGEVIFPAVKGPLFSVQAGGEDHG